MANCLPFGCKRLGRPRRRTRPKHCLACPAVKSVSTAGTHIGIRCCSCCRGHRQDRLSWFRCSAARFYLRRCSLPSPHRTQSRLQRRQHLPRLSRLLRPQGELLPPAFFLPYLRARVDFQGHRHTGSVLHRAQGGRSPHSARPPDRSL